MKTFKIDNIEIKNRYILAPMAGFTDYSFRTLAANFGADLVYTEMVSCESALYKSKATLFDLEMTRKDRKAHNAKIALQIFGGKKEHILKSIPIIEKEADYDFLDFNCGCPVPKVVRQNAGSKWLTRLDELYDLLKELIKISHKPVLLKIRTGFNEELDLVNVCKNIEQIGIKAIAIHGRKRSDFFSGEVNYKLIGEVKKNLTIPIIANGNISLDNIDEVIKVTNADGYMVGQKALGNPQIFENLLLKEEKKDIKKYSIFDSINILKKHLDLIYSYLDEKRASDIMRGFSTHYIRGSINSAKLRNQLVKCKSKKEYFDILDEYFSELSQNI